jgi:hypothetical protein
MRLQAPFFIGSRLLPALRIGDAVLSLDLAYQGTRDGRDRATFYLDFAGGTSYRDDSLRSGVGGFRGVVEVFESFLTFLMAAAENYNYGSNDELLFPPHICEWAGEHNDDIELSHSDICDENGNPRTELITEE